MTTDPPHANPTNPQADPDRASFMEREFTVGIGQFSDRTSASGSRDFVESALNSESRALIRQGIFVITFVPITVTFISKLPDIILALTAALR